LPVQLAVMFGWLWFSSADIQSDEVVVFYPTFAAWDRDQSHWKVQVHGSIFEPELNSRKRAALIHTLRGAMRINKSSAEADLLKRRLQLFLVDNERGKTVSIRLGERRQQLDPSAANGHLYASFQLSADEANQLLGGRPAGPGWGAFRAVTSTEDKRQFSGRIQFVPEDGLSVISDIDDTIKETRVTERSEMLANTFTRKFRAVEGMAGLYKKAADQGVVFHYVSGSPWQLYEPLSEFFADTGFPSGSFHLKHFRIKDSTLFDLFASQEAIKITAISTILDAFPRRRFILVGDSSEQDPEIYGRIARQYPKRIAGIFIRQVSDESVAADRLATAFRDIDAKRWQVFAKADEIKPAFTQLLP